jgi:3',5'-cyclic AMP phosphodiesterase CpdA
VIITGDLVNKAGDAAQMAEYERIKARIAPGIPVYQMPGNHDVGNAPTPATVAAYRARFGPDHYEFRYQNLLGIVLDSTVIAAPDGVATEYADQQRWLEAELAAAKASGAKHVVVFQHHPWFLAKADEPDGYYNIPRARRDALLEAFRGAGITTLVSGHYHQNAVATDAGFEMITTGPVGRPTGAAASGMRVFLVTDAAITHRYFAFGEIPTSINAASGRLGPSGPGAGATPGAAPPTGRVGR